MPAETHGFRRDEKGYMIRAADTPTEPQKNKGGKIKLTTKPTNSTFLGVAPRPMHMSASEAMARCTSKSTCLWQKGAFQCQLFSKLQNHKISYTIFSSEPNQTSSWLNFDLCDPSRPWVHYGWVRPFFCFWKYGWGQIPLPNLVRAYSKSTNKLSNEHREDTSSC